MLAHTKSTVVVDGFQENEVEAILKPRLRKHGQGSRTENLVHWQDHYF